MNFFRRLIDEHKSNFVSGSLVYRSQLSTDKIRLQILRTKKFFSSFNGKSSHFKFTSLRKLILPETAGNKESLEKNLKPHAGKKRPGSCKKITTYCISISRVCGNNYENQFSANE